ncbi:hypothetical protein DPSP01_003232 [Paraphaeosphaeria sporulosa]|uniref:Uncharacterized protein n=1 Tax=Paraphaeosphaeria sporulosa TaxID=1460663 RepID=A0A177CZ26_9PLEO|nr:uncharacterized protein CC84DRAFT_1159462 [Paraphaeosphaeria sporulosa]OAG12090.1 hypothetical protein CC84DRAFT_1159462 [Paraphaeosphaeria sporulosa]
MEIKEYGGRAVCLCGSREREDDTAGVGAYIELFADIAPSVEDGDFVIPPGRKGNVSSEHIHASTVAKEGKGNSVSAQFYEW